MSLTTKRLAIAAAVALILLGAGGTAAFRANTAEAQSTPAAPPPPPTVDVAEVVRRNIVDWQTYSGRLEAVDRVEIRPLVSGTLTTVNVREGGRVKKGDPLFVIDPRPYAVEVERTRALVRKPRSTPPSSTLATPVSLRRSMVWCRVQTSRWATSWLLAPVRRRWLPWCRCRACMPPSTSTSKAT